MQNSPILLSVVVPTKNRYYYLKYLLKYVKEISLSQIEVIVQDNSDDKVGQKDFENWLRDFKESTNIIYEYIDYPLSVIENSDLAVKKANGKYVMFIGDDDIFSKHVLKLLFYMDKESIHAAFPKNSSYSWPSVKSRLYGDKLSGKYTPTPHTAQIKVLSGYQELVKLLQTGGTDILQLPRVYHGIVSRKILESICRITGSYFPGPSPDMANAVAVSLCIDKYIVVDIPYIVSGHSRQSTGGQGAEGKHFGEIRDIKHLPVDTADNWNEEVPFYWSGYTIYAESVMQSLNRMKQDSLLEKINLNYLYATCLVFDTNYKDRIWKTINNNKKDKGVSLFTICFLYVKVWFHRIAYHVKHNAQYLSSKKNTDKVLVFENILEVARYNDVDISNRSK